MEGKHADLLALTGVFLEICCILSLSIIYISSFLGLTEYTVEEINKNRGVPIVGFLILIVCIVFCLTNFSKTRENGFFAKLTYWISVFFGITLVVLYVFEILVTIALILIIIFVIAYCSREQKSK